LGKAEREKNKERQSSKGRGELWPGLLSPSAVRKGGRERRRGRNRISKSAEMQEVNGTHLKEGMGTGETGWRAAADRSEKKCLLTGLLNCRRRNLIN